jgi:hypothetical protein
MMCFDEKVEKVEKVGFVFSSESRERTWIAQNCSRSMFNWSTFSLSSKKWGQICFRLLSPGTAAVLVHSRRSTTSYSGTIGNGRKNTFFFANLLFSQQFLLSSHFFRLNGAHTTHKHLFVRFTLKT